MVAAQKEEPAGRGVYLHCPDSGWEGTCCGAGTLLWSACSMHLFLSTASLSPTSPISFQSFLLNTVPTLQQRLLGAQYMWAAHSGERTNFSISETPAAKAKKKPSGPEIMTFPEKSTGWSCQVASLDCLCQAELPGLHPGRVGTRWLEWSVFSRGKRSVFKRIGPGRRSCHLQNWARTDFCAASLG